MTSLGDENDAVQSNHIVQKAQGKVVSRMVREFETFEILGFKTYHVGFNTGYNIAAGTNLVDHFCPGSAINISKRTEQVRAYSQCLLPIELINKKETNFIINIFREHMSTVA